MIDRPAVARAIAELLRAIGEDTTREGLARTPERVAEMYAEIFGGLHEDPRVLLSGGFDEAHEEMVVLRDIRLQSVCEHHLLPFVGTAHVGY
nr:GTP cyclohydrolase I [Chloroflexota bacterium]